MKRLLLFAAFFVLFALLACSAEQPSPTTTSTRRPTAAAPTLTSTRRPTAPARSVISTRRPTATVLSVISTRRPTAPARSVISTRRVTRRPTATVPPTDTPVPAPHFTVNRERVNVRAGPGIVFSIIGTVEQGDRFDIGGRNGAGDWLEFCCVNGQRGWIYAPLLIVSEGPAPIRLAQNIPTPPPPTNTPVPPPDTPTPASQPSPPDGLGVTIASENRCSPYNSDDYSYSQSVEPRIVSQQGGRIYSPYSGRYFASTGETDIEHIVARSEAHDSGLCAANNATRRAFANDLLNLTLASPSLNRHQKIAKDVAEWLPPLNQCWYVNQIVQVKRKYNLSMDQAEASRAQQILASCASTDMQFTDPGVVVPTPAPTSTGGQCSSNPLGCYDSNGNGRITCAEAREHGIAPVPRDHPAYQYMNDRDNDGIVCE